MKKAFLIPILILASCTSNTTADKEKELLEKELALTKKELELTKLENEKTTGEQESTEKPKSEAKQADIESLVFSTKMLSYPKKATINGKEYTITIKQEFMELNDGGPDEYYSTLVFAPSNLPNLKLGGHLSSFIVKDLNKDGIEEIIACAMGLNGTWGQIETYRLTDKLKWVKPFASFSWWTMEEGCDATMHWSPNKKQMRINTTNMINENVDCSDVIRANWK